MTARMVPGAVSLIGRYVRLDPAVAQDVDELADLTCDPSLYSEGFVMFPCPENHDQARPLQRAISSHVSTQTDLVPAAAPSP